MLRYKTISKKHLNFEKLEETEEGISIETKVRNITETNAPIEAVSPMIYTERRDGVQPEYNIRTDKWDIAQQAMTTIADGKREKRAERMKSKQENAVKPDGGSEVNVSSTQSA